MTDENIEKSWFWDSQIRALKFIVPQYANNQIFMLVHEEEAWQKKKELERRNYETEGKLVIEIVKIEDIPRNAMLKQHRLLQKDDYPVLAKICTLMCAPPRIEKKLTRFIF